jgi:phospholipase/lecithinase/hemolysin
MKKILALFLFFMIGMVNAGEPALNKMVFFGDSLTDNGNLYSLLLHIIPKSPPYFNGRFTNGPTWAEDVAKRMGLRSDVYAYGGATAVFHMPTSTFIAPTLLELEVDSYLFYNLFSSKNRSLFAIWIGGNDYLFGPSANMDADTQQVVDKISWAVNKLIYEGGKNFVVLNLPDLSVIPQVQDERTKEQLHEITILHNQKLQMAMQDIQNANPDVRVTYVDLYAVFNDARSDLQKFNQKYNANLTNISEACWKGGYVLKSALTEDAMTKDIQQTLMANQAKLPEEFDAKSLSQFITHNPELARTYQLGKSYEFGNIPCGNPEEYLFWDSIHPTAGVHDILAQIVVEKLGTRVS